MQCYSGKFTLLESSHTREFQTLRWSAIWKQELDSVSHLCWQKLKCEWCCFPLCASFSSSLFDPCLTYNYLFVSAMSWCWCAGSGTQLQGQHSLNWESSWMKFLVRVVQAVIYAPLFCTQSKAFVLHCRNQRQLHKGWEWWICPWERWHKISVRNLLLTVVEKLWKVQTMLTVVETVAENMNNYFEELCVISGALWQLFCHLSQKCSNNFASDWMNFAVCVSQDLSFCLCLFLCWFTRCLTVCMTTKAVL